MAAPQHDIYTDPAIAKAKLDDPIFNFIVARWQKLLTAAIVAAILIFLYNGYQTSTRETQMRAADLFSKVRATAQELERIRNTPPSTSADQKERAASDEKQKSDLASAREKFDQQLKALAESPAPYSDLTAVYRALALAYDGDSAAALQSLAKFGSWSSISEGNLSARLVPELAALARARILIDDDKSLGEGRSELVALANKSIFAAASAALSLAQISSTESERAEALTVLESLARRAPEQSDLLRDEIERLRSK